MQFCRLKLKKIKYRQIEVATQVLGISFGYHKELILPIRYTPLLVFLCGITGSLQKTIRFINL